MSQKNLANVYWPFIEDVQAFAGRQTLMWEQVRQWCLSGWPVNIVTANADDAVRVLAEFQRRGHVRLWHVAMNFVTLGAPIALRIDARSQRRDVLVSVAGRFQVRRSAQNAETIQRIIQQITEEH